MASDLDWDASEEELDAIVDGSQGKFMQPEAPCLMLDGPGNKEQLVI